MDKDGLEALFDIHLQMWTNISIIRGTWKVNGGGIIGRLNLIIDLRNRATNSIGEQWAGLWIQSSVNNSFDTLIYVWEFDRIILVIISWWRFNFVDKTGDNSGQQPIYCGVS